MEEKEVFEKYESEVRSYCRVFTEVLDYAKGSIIKDTNGKEYIDFFCGAGAVNYGHNNDYIKEKVIKYLQDDRIMHALDMYTKAKKDFSEYFEEEILKERNLNYKIQFPGPTGTNAIEAALKLARKVKKRNNIWCLMGCFHGMTLGSLALTSDKESRQGAGVSLENVTHIPAPYMFKGLDTIDYMQTILDDDHSGIEKPAAIIIETVQAEGGIWVFEKDYLQRLRKLCDDNDILLIVDDVQVGNARTGTFFSFERANIVPDMVTLSKSIGGYGMPFALTLIKPELDIWAPGEHNGTFRGNQLAMVASKAGLEFMKQNHIEEKVRQKGEIVKEFLEKEIKPINSNIEIRGIGLIWGIETHNETIAKKISTDCFKSGLIVERAGRNNSVVKIMPPLTIDEETLLKGLNILKQNVEENMK